MIKILHVFENEESLRWHSMMARTLGIVDELQNRVNLGPDVRIHRTVVNTLDDCINIAGLEFHHIEWFYVPTAAVEHYVRTRVRGTLKTTGGT